MRNLEVKMAGVFEINTYDEIICDADEVLSWLKSLRVNVTDSRLVDYRETVRILNDTVKKRMIAQAQGTPTFIEVCDSFFELSIISSIHKQLKDEKAYPPIRRLRLVTKGPFLSLDEKKSDPNRQARDFQFELLTLAMMKKQGMVYEPLLANTDVSGIFEERPIIMECKRLWSVKRVEENIQTGISQLIVKLNQLPDKSRPIGLLGLDFTRIETPPGYLLECVSQGEIEKRLGAIAEKYLRYYEYCWSETLDIRFIAVVAYIGATVALQERPWLSTGHEFVTMNRRVVNSTNFQFLTRLFRS